MKYNKENAYLINTFLLYLFILVVLIFVDLNTNFRNTNFSSIFTISLPITLGIVYENIRLGSHWKYLLLKVSGSLIISYVLFHIKIEDEIPSKQDLEIWLIFFIFTFAIISMVFHEKKIFIPLSEGVTLLQSISIVYWLATSDVFSSVNFFTISLAFFCLNFIVLTLIHSFSYMNLSRRARLFLSIWSSIIMMVFGVSYIFMIFTNDLSVDDNLYFVLYEIQYFLLGMSLINIIYNIRMLLVYLPKRGGFYNKEKMEEIKKTNTRHILRYSDSQIKISDSLLIFIATVLFYFLNYKFDFMPKHVAIWLMFLFLSIIFDFKKQIEHQKKLKNNCSTM